MSRDSDSLRPRSREILKLIARGHSYEQILAAHPGLTYRNIFRAAREALELLGPGDVEPTEPSSGTIRVQDERLLRIRAEHPRAYEPWTKEEDLRLGSMLAAGKTAEEIAEVLQRKRGAITSRLTKLGLA
jgi:DNA-binding CsgD family transcriptional regulator